MPTPDTIRECFRLLIAAGCRNRPSDDMLALTAEVWAATLGDVSDADLRTGTIAYLRSPESTWWPAPGALLAHVPGQALAAIDDADEVWGRVREASGRGAEAAASLPWSPATLAAVRAVGGWDRIGYTPYDQHVALRAAFRNAYRSARGRERLEQEHPQLTDSEARGFFTRLEAHRKGEA